MIHIYRADSELAVALFDLKTNKFKFGELCSKERLIRFVSSFPEHPVVIYVERAWKDEVQEIFFLLPHLQNTATVKTVRKLSPREMLAKVSKNKQKKSPVLMCMCVGIMIGCLLLFPKSLEYRDSVLAKAKNIEDMTEEFLAKHPEKESVQNLYTSLSGLYAKVNVETITYSTGSFKVVFSSINGDLKSESFDGLEKATLTKVATLDDGNGVYIYVYEMEGNL